MLTGLACLCRPCHLAGPAHAAATARFSIQEGEIPRETDCLLEEGVWSEPVSEIGFSTAGNYGNSETFMDDNRREKGYFGLENGGVSVFAPWQLARYLVLSC